MASVSLSRISRPEKDGYGGSVSEIIENHHRQEIRRLRYTGIGLTLTFMFLWLGTMLLMQTRPDWFGLMRMATCQ
jgi:hypothetical protein